MRCPKCSSTDSSVIDSRGDDDVIRRRRECEKCNFRFTTFERLEFTLPMIVKKDGRREPFDRNKLRSGLVKACEKRPISVEVIDKTVTEIERKIHELYLSEMPSERIGDLLMEALSKIDKIAYVRFASVYREFSDVSQFVDTLKGLLGSDKIKSERKKGLVRLKQAANS